MPSCLKSAAGRTARVSSLQKALSMLSLARRAHELLIGQDNIFEALRGGKKLAAFVTEDCSENVLRRLQAAVERGEMKVFVLKDTDRTLLGKHLGINAAQAAALPEESGFAEKIVSLLNEDRSDADE